MDKKFLKAKDIAQLWGITPRRVISSALPVLLTVHTKKEDTG